MIEFINEFWQFLRHRKKFWMLPLVIILVLIGIMVFLSSGSALAPFIYSLF